MELRPESFEPAARRIPCRSRTPTPCGAAALLTRSTTATNSSRSAATYSIGCRRAANTGSGASIRARRCLSPCLRSSPDAGPTSTRRIKLVVLGDRVLDWRPERSQLPAVGLRSEERRIRLTGPLATRRHCRRSSMRRPRFSACRPQSLSIPRARKEPGSIDFMRDKVKHVVYLMLENRSFDHVLGWLYQKGETGINFVGRDGDFDGASLEMFNVDPSAPQADRRRSTSRNTTASRASPLDFLPVGPVPRQDRRHAADVLSAARRICDSARRRK